MIHGRTRDTGHQIKKERDGLVDHYSYNIKFYPDILALSFTWVWDSLSIVNQYFSPNKVLLIILQYPRSSTGTCNLNWIIFFLYFFKKYQTEGKALSSRKFILSDILIIAAIKCQTVFVSETG